MSWQDIVVGIGQALFAIALIPALRSLHKPPRSTCILTGTILLIFSATFATLDLKWGSATAAVCGALWLVLWWQQRKKGDIWFALDVALGPDIDVMVHVGCGGEVIEDPSITYEYESSFFPAYRCKRCGAKILGDSQISLPGDAQ
jgi:hypothetical protein